MGLSAAMDPPLHPLPVPPPNPSGDPLRNHVAPQPSIDYAPIQSAGKLISQNLSADEKYPEMFEQLIDNEPHNYFFEPYQSHWRPQTIIQGGINFLPSALLSEYQLLECMSLMGLLPDINRAWMSIDSKLFLWNYTAKDQFYVYDGLDQVIVCVGLVPPKPGIFRDFVKHIMVIATPVEIVLMAVVFDNNDEISGDITLRTTQFAIPTDNVNMVKIVGFKNGRIFMAGKDGCLYELIYDSGESLSHYIGLGKKCKKVNHSYSYLGSVLPSFIRNISHPGTPLRDMLIDSERNILYTLSSSSVIQVYDLGSLGDTILSVTQKNAIDEAHSFCTRNQRGNTSVPDGRIFANRSSATIVSISLISTEESKILHLVAITNTGIRLYFSTWKISSSGFQSKLTGPLPRPSTLELAHVRLPPPSVEQCHSQQNEGFQPGFVAERTCSNIHTVFYNNGEMLMVDSPVDHHDRIIAINRDLMNRSGGMITSSSKTIFRESVNQLKIEGKVWQIIQVDPPSESTNENKKIISEMVKQFSEPRKRYLCLTNTGIYTFIKLRPIDQLQEILNLQGQDNGSSFELDQFVRGFGVFQSCCMLFGIACGVAKSDNIPLHRRSFIQQQAIQAISSYGGQAGIMDYKSAQSSDGRLVMTDDAYMSHHHDGLCLFLSRMLRPVWEQTIFLPKNGKGIRIRYSKHLLMQIREPLFQLQQIMEVMVPYSLAIQQDISEPLCGNMEPSKGNTMTRMLNMYSGQHKQEQAKRESALKREQCSVNYLYKLLVHCVEGFSLLIIAIEQLSRSNTSTLLSTSIEDFQKITFCDMITTERGLAGGRMMIERIMGDLRKETGKVEILAASLRAQCPHFFSAGDMLQYQGYDLLLQARATQSPRERKEMLNETLSQFLRACRFWKDASYVQILKSICTEYVEVCYYDGVVDLALHCAENYAPGDDCRLACYRCILDVFELLLDADGTAKTRTNIFAALNVLQPETRKNFAQFTLERALASRDVYFHHALYSWLFEKNYTNILVEIRSTFIEEFLKGKDIELLCNYLVRQRKYIDAMNLLHQLAVIENKVLKTNPILTQRIKHFTRAIQCGRSAVQPGSGLSSGLHTQKVATTLNDLQEKVDVASLQMRVLTKLVRQTKSLSKRSQNETSEQMPETEQLETSIEILEYKLIDVSTLYNKYASKLKMWEICLAILHSCKHEDPVLIARHWKRIIYKQIPSTVGNPIVDVWLRQQHYDADDMSVVSTPFENELWMNNLRNKVLTLGKELFNTGANFTFPVKYICRELETLMMKYRECHQGEVEKEYTWIVDLFREIGVPYGVLFDTYKSFYQEQSSPKSQIHALNSLCSLVENWKSEALRSNSTELAKVDFIRSSPQLFREFESFITDLQAMGEGWKSSEKTTCLERLRRLSNQLESARTDIYS